MKVFIRNRHKNYGNSKLFFPYQAVLWFKPEKSEIREQVVILVVRFHISLVDRKQTGLVYYNDSVGILFNHRSLADKAKILYKKFVQIKCGKL